MKPSFNPPYPASASQGNRDTAAQLKKQPKNAFRSCLRKRKQSNCPCRSLPFQSENSFRTAGPPIQSPSHLFGPAHRQPHTHALDYRETFDKALTMLFREFRTIILLYILPMVVGHNVAGNRNAFLFFVEHDLYQNVVGAGLPEKDHLQISSHW